MSKDKKTTVSSNELRRRAEERIEERPDCFAVSDNTPAFELQRLVHELKVHQIELELQNEELKHTRSQVEQALSLYTDLFEFAPVGYLTLDREGTIHQINLAGARLFGFERPSLIGRRFSVLVNSDYRPTFDSFLLNVFASADKVSCEVVLYLEGGTSLVVELTGTGTGGGHECRIAVMDITLKKRIEKERENLLSQLAQSKKMEAIGTFAGGIAHDFNNLLGSLLGGLSLLDINLGKDNVHHAEILEMQTLVERGADLTKQLLGFARRGKYEVKPLHLTHIIEKMTSMFGHTHRNIAIDLDMAADLAAVLMDQSQLEQVLLNLFINADQAMSDGGRLHLRAENTVLSAKQAEPHGISAGRFVKLIVSDTGIGMDVVTKERIFEPFFTTKGPGLGTGLGLASVYGIIKSHGGVITVDSELGRGAAFTLFLPSTDRPFEKETKKRPSIQPGRGTILIVDDEEIIVKVYSALLTKIGYNVLSASGGKQAVEIARRLGHEISLVILDLVMPDMNGKETFHALKEIAPHIKVLLSSGYSIEGQAQELLSKGCDGFIQKPCSLAVLSAKLKEIL